MNTCTVSSDLEAVVPYGVTDYLGKFEVSNVGMSARGDQAGYSLILGKFTLGPKVTRKTLTEMVRVLNAVLDATATD